MCAAARPVSETEALTRLDLLTSTEREILRLLGEGLAAQQIADRVERGKCTIETHIRHIGDKTGWRGQQRLTRLGMLAALRDGATGPVHRDPEVVHQLREEIAGHGRSRAALERVVAATADVTGEEFLSALVMALGQALRIRLAAVLETVAAGDAGAARAPEERFRTVAWSLDGVAQAPVEMAVGDSALAGLGRREERYIASGAAAQLRGDPLARSIAAATCLGVPLRDGDGVLLGGVVLMHDAPLDAAQSPELIVRLFAGRAAAEIERRRTELRLREREFLYRTLAENSGDIISRFNAVGSHLYASPAAETILGWKPEELIGHSGYDLIYAEDIERVGPVHHAAVANPGVPHRVRWRGRRRDGSLVWLETVVRAVPNAATGEMEMLTVTRDVGAEQAALARLDRANSELEARVRERTAALAHSEQRWRSALQHANDFICIFDPDLRITFFNRHLPKVDPSTVIGTYEPDFLAPDSRDEATAALRRVLASGASELVEMTTLTDDGRVDWSVRISPLIVDGEIVGLTTISRDVTETNRVEAALRDSEASYRALVELAPDGILVHDGTVVRFANAAASAMFGFDGDAELVGSPIMERVPEHLRSVVRARIDRVLGLRANVPRLRLDLLRRDGAPLQVETSATWCAYQGMPCVQLLIRDRSTEDDRTPLNGVGRSETLR